MKFIFNKIMASLLVLMVMLLPLRAMAMPIDMSPDHCMGADMTQMSDSTPTIQSENHEISSIGESMVCKCCKQCADCTNMTAVSLSLLQLSYAEIHEIDAITAESMLTRVASPPSRPPRVL